MNTEYHRLPSGKFTTSIKVYLREWKKLGRIVEKKLGVAVYGFDPDFAVRSKTYHMGGHMMTANIPLWLAFSIQRQNSAP